MKCRSTYPATPPSTVHLVQLYLVPFWNISITGLLHQTELFESERPSLTYLAFLFNRGGDATGLKRALASVSTYTGQVCEDASFPVPGSRTGAKGNLASLFRGVGRTSGQTRHGAPVSESSNYTRSLKSNVCFEAQRPAVRMRAHTQLTSH